MENKIYPELEESSNNYSTNYLNEVNFIVAKLRLEGDKVAYNLILNRVDADEIKHNIKGICEIKTLEFARSFM